MIGKYQEIKNDLFSISKRLKNIDKGYFLLYSYKKKRFEVHHRGQRGGSFCLAVPYSVLDERTLTLVQRTRAERAKQLFIEMEKQNENAKKNALYDAIKKAEGLMENTLKQI